MGYDAFDYDTLVVGDYYEGIDNGKADENGEFSRSIPFVGKFFGVGSDQRLKALTNPDSRASRQVYLLVNDPKYGRAWRAFDPETLTHIPEPSDDQLVVDDPDPENAEG